MKQGHNELIDKDMAMGTVRHMAIVGAGFNGTALALKAQGKVQQ